MKANTKNFQFKQFTIWGGHSGMPVSTDGVLLGAWAKLSDRRHLLDIGTGTGLLTLMCAQRQPNLLLTSIDIDPHATEAAQTNFSASPWAERITLRHYDVSAFTRDNLAQFDGIICNPPYFNSGEQSAWVSRATARHTSTLSHPELLSCCEKLLQPQGTASFILPSVEAEQFIELAIAQKWQLTRLCKVKTTARKNHSRYLFELQLIECTRTKTEESELIIHQNEGYSRQFVALTQSFYLKM
ncbi:tRNA1(Val) (adenine(37)-N6)-methyltransferase [Vibrio ezurae]|uniref:tRNA1(Val) (adenine(37)-N6)-methyltransferase n=1 Tax=Vibrio ezurae NBRC 102218 TaxID=1219080 RepID=U3CRK3_9VIBR|nr:methyltransferase [Vibrio ezurae]GAD80718.1 tRNA (adenine-N(6)-)-methyltransferase [Vibrio ezurae NBRC 102218]